MNEQAIKDSVKWAAKWALFWLLVVSGLIVAGLVWVQAIEANS